VVIQRPSKELVGDLGAVPPSARRGATGGKEKHLRVREEFRGFEMKK
jgi:hypothetical protein